jgi:hypothetical protein
MTRPACATIAVFAVFTAACSDRIDVGDAEDRAKAIAEQAVGSPVASVDCPAARRDRGVIVPCRVRFAEGGEHVLRLAIVNDRGGILPSWERPVISRTVVATEAAAQLGTGATVDCGRGVEAAPVELACTIADGDARSGVEIRVDASGRWQTGDAPVR